jgi:8-oxo-dGTP pyrophosphatase MutT (NUDIX family)
MPYNLKNHTDWQNLKRQLSPLLHRKNNRHPPKGYTCAAVVIPLVIVDGDICVLFTKRTATVRDHQNQMSFPGGACESTDRTVLETALREMNEEIGVSITLNAILGALAPRKTVTGYFITPFVAMINSLEKMKLNTQEVEKVILVPLNWLADPNNYSVQPYSREGADIEDVIFFTPFQNETIWGITAGITLDFVDLIKK